MDLEYKTVTLEINAEFQSELKKYIDEKWEIQPGTQPVAVYHLVRIKQSPEHEFGALGTLKIDDKNIHLIRGGKIVKPDGTLAGEDESKKILSGEAKPVW